MTMGRMGKKMGDKRRNFGKERRESMKGWNWKKWVEEKNLRKWFRRDNLIILVLTGILLIIIALPTKEQAGKEEGAGTQKTGEQEGKMWESEGSWSMGSEADAGGKEKGEAEMTGETEGDYASDLEERLAKLLSRMDGVGKVEVMITLKSSRELVVEKEQPVSHSSTHESDAQGGSRLVSETDSRENTVYRTEGSNSEPYVIKTLPPKIEGVLVVAQGAGNGTVNRTIVETVQALFGVEAHKVKVVKMETGSGEEEK